LYTKYVKNAGVDDVYLRSVFYQCVDSSREWNVDDATDLMEVSLQLYLQDASRSRNVPTAILSSSNPAVAGSEEHSSHKHAVAARKLSGPISLASERILTTQEIDERKEQYLGTDEGVCVGACDVVNKKIKKIHTAILSSSIPTVEGEVELSDPTLRSEDLEPKEEHLKASQRVCLGACDVVKNFLGRPTNGSLPTPLPPEARAEELWELAAASIRLGVLGWAFLTAANFLLVVLLDVCWIVKWVGRMLWSIAHAPLLTILWVALEWVVYWGGKLLWKVIRTIWSLLPDKTASGTRVRAGCSVEGLLLWFLVWYLRIVLPMLSKTDIDAQVSQEALERLRQRIAALQDGRQRIAEIWSLPRYGLSMSEWHSLLTYRQLKIEGWGEVSWFDIWDAMAARDGAEATPAAEEAATHDEMALPPAIDFEGKARNNRSAQFGFGENEPSGVENEDPDAVANGDGRGRSNLDEGENGPNLEVGDPSRAPTPGEAAFESSWQGSCQQYWIVSATVNPQGWESASAGTERRRNRMRLNLRLRSSFLM